MNLGRPDLHAEVWQRFVRASATEPEQPLAREAWHKGRSQYAVWLVRIQADAIEDRVQRAQAALASWLEPHPLSELHVTLWVAGFIAEHAQHDDDVSCEVLEAQRLALTRAELSCALRVGGVSSFTSVAFLEVLDEHDALGRMRRVLDAHGRELRFARYVPHVTVGRYIRAVPVAEVARAIEPLRALEPIALEPAQLELVTFDGQVAAAALRTCARVGLRAHMANLE